MSKKPRRSKYSKLAKVPEGWQLVTDSLLEAAAGLFGATEGKTAKETLEEGDGLFWDVKTFNGRKYFKVLNDEQVFERLRLADLRSKEQLENVSRLLGKY